MTTDTQADFAVAREELRASLHRQNQLREYLVMNGADKLSHSSRMLLDHLLGVQGILQRTKSEEPLCTAGLFHSVYGTAIYQLKLISTNKREEVRALIGARAEEIVWTFCMMPGRPTVWEMGLSNHRHDFLAQHYKTKHSAPDQLWLDLLRLECANMLEQRAALHKFPFLMRHAKEMGMLDPEGFCV